MITELRGLLIVDFSPQNKITIRLKKTLHDRSVLTNFSMKPRPTKGFFTKQ